MGEEKKKRKGREKERKIPRDSDGMSIEIW
jgi:hypothetical protein